MIVVRLQTVVSREVAPGEIAVVTVGSIQAGIRSNIIPDHAVLQLNVRAYSSRAASAYSPRSSGSCAPSARPAAHPRTPTSRPWAASRSLTTTRPPRSGSRPPRRDFGDHAGQLPAQTVSEDFSIVPDAAGIPYTYWGIGRTDRQIYLTAEKEGRLQDLPSNHSPKFLPLQPTLRTGTEALTTAALAWLAPEQGT